MAEFAAGTFAVLLLGGLILTLGPGRAILSLVPHPDATTRYILETIAGAAMIVVSVVLFSNQTMFTGLVADTGVVVAVDRAAGASYRVNLEADILAKHVEKLVKP